MTAAIDERVVSQPIKVLIIEDNPVDADLEVMELRRAAIPVEHRVADDEPQLKSVLRDFRPDVILCDLALRDMSGVQAIRIAHPLDPNIPAIIVTGSVTEQQAAVAMHSGAVDYILKSNLQRLGVAVLRAVDDAVQKKQHALVRWRLDQAREQLATIADTVDSVLSSYSIPDRKFTYVSTIAERVYGYTAQYFLSKPELWKETILSADRAAVHLAAKRIFVEDHYDVDYRVVHASGEIRWVNHRARLARGDGGEPLRVDSVVIDITQRMEAQHRLRRLSRIRDVLSSVNAAVVRIRDKSELFREACRIAFEAGGFVNVFILELDGATGGLSVPAVAGAWDANRAILEALLRKSVGDPQHAGSVVTRVFETLLPAVENDLLAHQDVLPYQKLIEQGVLAVGAFPLVVDGDLVGPMIFHTSEIGYFDDEELALLTSLTINISFALNHLAKAERVARLSRIRDVLSAVNAAIVRFRDRDELFHEACRIAVEAGGFMNVFIAETDIENRQFAIPAFLGKSDRAEMERSIRTRLAETGRTPGNLESSIRSLRPSVKNALPHTGRRGREGVRSSGSFPLIVDDRAMGAMVFETEDPDYFDDEEVQLLTDLVNNLSFALDLLEKQRRVDYLSYYDSLTRLPNRTLFYNRLEQDLAASKKANKMLALVLLDVSRFSVLNNTLGEHVGDEVLRRIADRLRESAEEGRIARVAGDRFALCFPMLDDLRPVADVVTEDGIRFFDAPVVLPDREVHVMMRAGCAVFPNDGTDAEVLFQNAEAALSSAKASGTTYRVYAPELNARLAKQLDLEARLQRAIEEQQFLLYYQPKIELGSRRIVGFEALIRWNDPERGVVSPGDFIPLLEQTGIIITVGRWALNEATRQFEEWRIAGLNPPRIAVNLSAVQLLQDRLIDDVRGAVASFASGCGLDLEVTESMLMENFDASIAKLNAIRQLGVDLSLDDFGTGYSSLAYLHRLPLNALKIDRSFIVGMTEDANKTSIVSTIISLAQALKLKVIAEGVETEEQLRLLQLLRCDQIQGYLIGKPEPAEIAAAFLRNAP